MSSLTVKYRPRRLGQLIGQDKAVDKLRQLKARRGTFGGKAYFVTGRSGNGKSAMAECIARDIANDDCIVTFKAATMTPADVEWIEGCWHTYGWGKGGRAFIVEEVHRLRRDTLAALLVACDTGKIPGHAVICFTTTNDGLSLFEDGQEDAGPFRSRCTCISLTSQGFAPVAARFAKRVAMRHGLDGQPLARYVRLANDKSGNLRAMLEEVEDGAMCLIGERE